jgi:hypothetical protein
MPDTSTVIIIVLAVVCVVVISILAVLLANKSGKNAKRLPYTERVRRYETSCTGDPGELRAVATQMNDQNAMERINQAQTQCTVADDLRESSSADAGDWTLLWILAPLVIFMTFAYLYYRFNIKQGV